MQHQRSHELYQRAKQLMPGGVNSAVHTDDDLERTVAAFREAVVMLKREGEL